jgi:hypothetical protein
MVSNFVYINKSLYWKNWTVNCLAWYVLWWCLTPWRNPSIMHSKGKREQHQWTEANKLVKEEFAEMNQLYYLLQGHGNWPLPLHARQGVLSLGSEESALKSPSVTWPCPLHLRHGSFVTPSHSSHNFKDLRWERATKGSTLGAAKAAIRSSAPKPKSAISLAVILAMAPAC